MSKEAAAAGTFTTSNSNTTATCGNRKVYHNRDMAVPMSTMTARKLFHLTLQISFIWCAVSLCKSGPTTTTPLFQSFTMVEAFTIEPTNSFQRARPARSTTDATFTANARHVLSMPTRASTNEESPTIGNSMVVDKKVSTVQHAMSKTSLTGVSMLLGLLLVVGGSLTYAPQPASATYSAYVHREEDWKAREKAGEIKVSSARSLRNQLNEIAPMNSKNQIFCPNGPTAAVSPLMENRCGDRLATPSVFGRSDDAMGNSIPGFAPSWTGASSSSSVAENVGGFPTDYGFTAGRKSSQYSIK